MRRTTSPGDELRSGPMNGARVSAGSSPAAPITNAIPSIRSFGDKAVAVWMNVSSGSGSEQRVHYATSSDSGASFTDFGAVPAPVNWRWRSDPAIAVDPVSAPLARLAPGAQVQEPPALTCPGDADRVPKGCRTEWTLPGSPRFVTLIPHGTTRPWERGPDHPSDKTAMP